MGDDYSGSKLYFIGMVVDIVVTMVTRFQRKHSNYTCLCLSQFVYYDFKVIILYSIFVYTIVENKNVFIKFIYNIEQTYLKSQDSSLPDIL